jgi:hypothetical protein
MYREYAEWTAMATPVLPHCRIRFAFGGLERAFRALSAGLVQQVPHREVAAYVEAVGDAVQCGWLNEVAEGYRLLDLALADAECIPVLPGRRHLVRGYRKAMVLYVDQFWPRERSIEVVDPADLDPSGF